jgi:hypothetical protein
MKHISPTWESQKIINPSLTWIMMCIIITPQGEEFWPLQSRSEDSGVLSGLQLPHWSSLGSVRVHSLTLFALPGACELTPGSPSWPATLPHLALVTSPRLRLRHFYFHMPNNA